MFFVLGQGLNETIVIHISDFSTDTALGLVALVFFLVFDLIHLTTLQTLSKPLADAFLTSLFLSMRFKTFRTIKLHITLFAGHFRSDPLGKIRTRLVSTTTGRAVLSDTVMVSTVLVAVRLLAVSTNIISVEERWSTSHAMVLVLCFQESNHLWSLIKQSVFKQSFLSSLPRQSAGTLAQDTLKTASILSDH